MVIVDTSVWIDYFRHGSGRLAGLLSENTILIHAFVVDELALGNLKNRSDVLQLLEKLPKSVHASNEEVLYFVEKERLYGKGLGFIDVHLLASARLSRARLWSMDRALVKQAHAMDLVF